MTRRCSLLAFALFPMAGGALAQTAYDPAIAYSLAQGRTTYLYVANADGSHAVRIASSGGGINGIDFAPGGGRIAYSTTNDGVHVLNYTASNSGVVASGDVRLDTGPASCADFSADGSRILYYRIGSPSGFRIVSASGGTPVQVHNAVGYGECTWLRAEDMGNAFAYIATVPDGSHTDYEIRVALLDGSYQFSSASTVLSTHGQAYGALDDVEAANTRNAILLTANFPTTVRFLDYDFGTAALVDRGGGGYRARYEAADASILYREQVKGGFFVNRLDLGSGATTHVLPKADYGAFAARR